MNRQNERYVRNDVRGDRDREEWRGSESEGREFSRYGGPQSRESFYPGDYGFNEGEHTGRTAGDEGSQPYSQSPYGYHPGQQRGGGQWRQDEWRDASSQRYGQRGGQYGGGQYGSEYRGSRWGGPQDERGSRYRESQYSSGRGAGGGQYGAGYGRSRHGYGAGMDSRLGEAGVFGEGPFSDTSESPGYFGTGYYGDGGASYGGGYDQRWRDRNYGSLGEDPTRSSRSYSGWGGRGGGWESSEGGRQQQRYRAGPKGYTRSDERLREDISERLMMADSIDSSEVTVSVKDAQVTLEGTVPDRRMKHVIEDLVDAAPGVQDVDNRIRVQRQESREGSSTSQRGSSSQSGAPTSGSSQSATGSTSSTGAGSTAFGSSGTSNGGKTRKES